MLDAAIRERLNGLDQEIEFCDESGKTVGYFVPAAERDRLKRIAEEQRKADFAWALAQISDAELDKAEQEGEEYSTEEVLKHVASQ